ncbi:MAG: FAD-dependent oxidoreductase, partial [Gammaproteobacteria bacterium]|nr:FAD-dependent oxidoreductase [Gammaproteobacteria bacterium]
MQPAQPPPARPGAGRYSLWRLLREGLRGQQGWTRAWRKASPRPRYRIVIVGGGGHGLSTAFHLASEHGITDVAVLERGPIGLGNVGRNTTIIRSNYFHPHNIGFYELSLRLWERLERELNFNAMVSQRGTLNLFHTEAQRDLFTRRANQMRLLGVDAEAVDPAGVRRLVPLVDLENGRYPVLGGFLQRRGGTVRHDAVAWGYARAASAAGVDVIEQCEVTGLRISDARVRGVETPHGAIAADVVCLAVAGHSSLLAAMAGLKLPIESHVLQAFVSEPVKPLLDVVLTYGAGHFYVSQSDKGGLVFGGAIDGYNTYAQRGTLP